MSAAPTFAELLDAALAAELGSVVTGGYAFLPAEPVPFAFRARIPDVGRVPSVRAYAGLPSSRRSERVVERRPARHLTSRQQDALAELITLGANIDADFTSDELRSAFRRLARRYHPDRHHGGGPAEHARLTRLFATVSTHYQCLRAALDRA